MKSSSSTPTVLPVLLRDDTRLEEGTSLERRLQFQQDSLFQRLKNAWTVFARKVTKASTGTPSNGLGDDATSITLDVMFPHPHRTQPTQDTTDWTVDEVFVTPEVHTLSFFRTDEQHVAGSVKSTDSIPRASSHSSNIMRTSFSVSSNFWLATASFFAPEFDDPVRERDFQKQTWYITKKWASFGSTYLFLNWILYVALNHPSTRYSRYAQIVYWGGLTLFTVPTPVMVAFDLPMKRPIFFQIWFCIAVWYCGITEIIEMKQCNFFDPANNRCFGKDFLAMAYYTTAVPAIMMFSGSRRLYNFIAQLLCFILLMTLVIPDQAIYARNVISFAIFSIFAQFLHYSKEKAERRIFKLSSELKKAYRMNQRSQAAEFEANNAKNRLASYIFHEVRVPLNVAQLAFDNLQSENVLNHEVMRNSQAEVDAMRSSLRMMRKVLDDALDLNKMDRGQFASDARPFPLHHIISSVLTSSRIWTTQKGLNLRVELDPRIDQINKESISSQGLWVIGDEGRLRQVLSNLLSNAIKFTPPNAGDITVITTLLSVQSSEDNNPSTPLPKSQGYSEPHPENGDQYRALRSVKRLNFKVEIHDHGPGVSPEDIRSNQLFQPFVQAAAGKRAGNGTGTGLGLAIVRQIVSLSGGRLGLSSSRGNGAVFWFELSYPLATSTQIQDELQANNYQALPSAAAPDPLIMAEIGLAEDAARWASAAPTYASQAYKVVTADTSDEKDTMSCGPVSPPAADADSPLVVLLVDDNHMTRTVMARTFSKTFGCIVDVAGDGKEFLDILTNPSSRAYDLVTLDNHMPIMTGEEAIAKLREMGRDDFVVGCTGNAVDHDRQKYIEAGVDDLLPKPLDHAKLRQLLEEARRRRLRRKPPNNDPDATLS